MKIIDPLNFWLIIFLRYSTAKGAVYTLFDDSPCWILHSLYMTDTSAREGKCQFSAPLCD